MPIIDGKPTSCGDCNGTDEKCRCCPHGVDAQGVAYSAEEGARVKLATLVSLIEEVRDCNERSLSATASGNVNAATIVRLELDARIRILATEARR